MGHLTVEQIAEVAHGANRALTKLVGDVPVQPSWSEAPEEMRASSVRGVEFALKHPEASASDQHVAWAADKIRAGWKHGPVKDEALKTHPALVAWSELPAGTQAKDTLFRALVEALRPLNGGQG